MPEERKGLARQTCAGTPAQAIRDYLCLYTPTNRAVDWLRIPRGLKQRHPVALVVIPSYVFAMSVCATIVKRGGASYLNVLVL